MGVQRLRQLISIRNILESRSVSGQVSTYMLLMIAGALTFTLAMAGLSNMFSQTNNLDRVTDNAALLLASRLANKSYQLYTALGNKTKICKGTGWLGILIIVVVIIILIIITIVTWGGAAPAWAALLGAVTATTGLTGTAAAVAAIAVLTVVGATIGAAGGAIGGAIDGSGAGRGALTGAMIGAAIGAGIGLGAAAGPAAIGLSSTAVSGATGIDASTMAVASTIGIGSFSLVGAIAGGAVAVASAAYNNYVANEITLATMSALQKSMMGLGERRSIREGIFFYGLTNTVDDPNRTRDVNSSLGGCHWTGNNDPLAMIPGDPDDIDGDGDKNESQSCFAIWWLNRMRNLQVLESSGRVQGSGPPPPPLGPAIREFIRGGSGIDTPLNDMRCSVRNRYTWSKTNCATGRVDRSIQCVNPSYCWGVLSRSEVEGTEGARRPLPGVMGSGLVLEPNERHNFEDCISDGHCPGSDGRLIYILKALYQASVSNNRPDWKPSFYEPGPDLAAIKAWQDATVDCTDDDTCITQALPAGFDEVDELIWEMQDFVDATKFLTNTDISQLAVTIDDWLPLFYDPLDPDSSDYYTLMNNYVDTDGKQLGWLAKINKWQTELMDIQSRFPACQWDLTNTQVTNAPCQGTINGSSFTNIQNGVPDMEFGKLLFSSFPALRSKIIRFRSRIKDFYDKIMKLQTEGSNEWGGTGERVIYKWDDARGSHWVEVRVSAFKMAKIKKKSGFLKSCVKLKNYEDTTGDNTWVRITRNSPPTRFGRLFTWNETADQGSDDDGGLGLPLSGLSKKSKALYGLNRGQPVKLQNGRINPEKWYVQLKQRQPI